MARWWHSTARAGRTSAISECTVGTYTMPRSMPSGSRGKDLRPLLLTRRKQLLTRLIPATTTLLSQVFSIEERGRDMFCRSRAARPGGIVAKRKADAYRPETVWYKIKNRAYSQGEGRWELFQKRRP